jgi:hypothetical protein
MPISTHPELARPLHARDLGPLCEVREPGERHSARGGDLADDSLGEDTEAGES